MSDVHEYRSIDLFGTCGDCPPDDAQGPEHAVHQTRPRPVQNTRQHDAIAATLPATASLIETRDWLLEHRDEGVACPACDQFVKVYPRHVYKGMALVLAAMYRAAGTDWVQVPRLTVSGGEKAKGGDFAKMRYWNLIEAMQGEREDGSSRVGWWRVTDFGVDYLLDRVRIVKYAYTYDHDCIAMGGDPVGIRDAFGSRFNYDELMNGVTP